MSSYQGWKNYETWCVGLHLSNDEGTYSMIREWVAELEDPANWPDDAEPTAYDKQWEIAERLKQLADDLTGRDDNLDVPTPGPLAMDLLGAALSEVDWMEIAETYIES